MQKDRLRRIFSKTDGYCHLCHKKLCFTNYGLIGARGNWNVEHSVAKAKGGSDHMNNLLPACISCNTEKRTDCTRTVRLKYGKTRAPYSKEKKETLRNENTLTGTIIGGALGSIFGPAGILVGAGIGAVVGDANSPRK